MTTIPTPEWLSQRGGQIRPGISANTWLILLSNMQEYAAMVTPAAGKFTCAVTQRNNGKRLDKATVYPTAEAAVQGGLEELKQALGWG
ncbi:MAG TPA: hypothetical protein VKS79_24520 [Gemmataceae bacterium]|nr:hypothetical protein [Gemmataceae bacterium]